MSRLQPGLRASSSVLFIIYHQF